MNLKIDVPSTWDALVNLGASCQSATTIISECAEVKNITGVIMFNSVNICKNLFGCGKLVGTPIRWIVGKQQYRGELSRDARLGSRQSNAKLLGIFAARRLLCQQR